MYAVAWKERYTVNKGGVTRVKRFSSETRRQNFITQLKRDTRFEIISQSAEDSYELHDFYPGARVKIKGSTHPEMIGKTGTVIKTVVTRCEVHIMLDDGKEFWSWVWNLDFA